MLKCYFIFFGSICVVYLPVTNQPHYLYLFGYVCDHHRSPHLIQEKLNFTFLENQWEITHVSNLLLVGHDFTGFVQLIATFCYELMTPDSKIFFSSSPPVSPSTISCKMWCNRSFFFVVLIIKSFNKKPRQIENSKLETL